MVVTGLIAASFAAGMVATFNPCGFAMLPAYLGLIIGDRGPGRGSALLVGVTVSTGFVAVFLITGVLVASGLRAIVTWIPWMALLVGLGLVAVGWAELRGAHVFARIPGVKRSMRGSSLSGLVGFGASYGVASLSCTLPIFLSLIAGAVAAGSIGETVAVFAAYGAGMSLVVIVLTVMLSAGRDRVLRVFRPIAARLGTVSGWVMIVAGVFIVWYWATVLISGASELGANPIVRFIEGLSADIAGFIASNPALAGLGALGLGVIVWLLTRRPTSNDDSSVYEDVPSGRRGGTSD